MPTLPTSPTNLIAVTLILIGYLGIISHTNGGTNINHKVWIFLPPTFKSLILDIFFLGRFFHKDKNLKIRKVFTIPLLLGIFILLYQYLTRFY